MTHTYQKLGQDALSMSAEMAQSMSWGSVKALTLGNHRYRTRYADPNPDRIPYMRNHRESKTHPIVVCITLCLAAAHFIVVLRFLSCCIRNLKPAANDRLIFVFFDFCDNPHCLLLYNDLTWSREAYNYAHRSKDIYI